MIFIDTVIKILIIFNDVFIIFIVFIILVIFVIKNFVISFNNII